jgi:predicted ATPase/DNA-binding SARP family transcriptional activator
MTTLEIPAVVPATELPIHLTRFIGRGRELDDVARLLVSTRLLTLTGAGGSGKTRLARETASRLAHTFGRVDWVDLAPLTDAELLPQQIATTLRVPERAGASPLETLIDVIADESMLLVLDNCEHLIDECAVVAEALLRAGHRLKILATSREALGVASETAWLVPPLATPEAMQLFLERAQSVLPSFVLTESNGPAVQEICRRLDGIPLAIELAAARVRVLTPAQIAARLGDAFRLLAGGNRTALPRHRTLRATMEWSFALLGEREQILLRRLAVFAGSFTLEAAESVCVGALLEADDILDGVSALVDRSLVLMEPGDGTARYRLLETVRQYGLERLAEANERQSFERRHAEYFLEMIETAAPRLVGGPATPELLAGLVAEQDNLRAAAHWSVDEASRGELGLRFVGATYWFWYARGQFREARQLADRALALDVPADVGVRGRALAASALTALSQGEYARSCAQFEAALPMLRAANDVHATGAALAKYGAARLFTGDVDGAVATLDEAIELTRDAPPHDMAGIFARFWRGWAAYAMGEIELAHTMIASNIRVAREQRLATTLAHGLTMLARVDVARGNVREACTLVTEGLELEVTNGDPWGIALALDVIALIAFTQGHTADAARLLAAIIAHCERMSAALAQISPTERIELLAQVRAALGERFDALYTEGFTLSTPDAVSLALTVAARHTSEHRIASFAPAPAESAAELEQRRLRVLALGPLQVYVGDRLIESSAWGSARPRELLMYLLIHSDGRTKEQVGLAFWPDASQAQLRNNFHVTLHRLRRALGGAGWIVLDGERYRVDPALLHTFDALEFAREVVAARRALQRQEEGATARLEQALALYRGDFLDGEPAGDWHVEHRDHLQRLYVDALMELGARFLREQRHARAAEVFRRVLARDELHEEALLGLMRCLADAGERSQALRAYRQFAERLRRELDADPEEETTRLFEELRGATAS